MEINPLQIWRYNETGKQYAIVYVATMKINDTEWIPSVTYQCLESGLTFTRDKATFVLKFSKVKP
jgi:hypothetical protein